MRKTVLYFHKANDYTGSTRALSTLIGLESARVITLNINGAGFLSDMVNVEIVPVLYPRVNGHTIPLISFIISYISRVIQTLKFVNKVDIFYINTISPFYAAIIGRLFQKEIVYHIHEKIIKPKIVDRIAELVFNHTPSKTIYVSKYLSECYPHKIGSYSVIYNKLSEDFLSKVSISPILERKRNTVLMISSLSKEKGIDVFCEVAALIPNLQFILVLSTDQKSIDSYFSNELPNNITVLPKQRDLSPYYRHSDLLLNLTQPSMCIETFGLTILEAMPYGIPAIVPNVGGPVELVDNDYNGYRINVENPQEVVKAIYKSIEEGKYNILANNALKKYKELYG